MIDCIKGYFITNEGRYLTEQVCHNTLSSKDGIKSFRNDYKVDGISISYNPINNMVIFQNSLHKFYLGNNIEDFKESEIKMAVEKLCEYLKVKDDNSTLNISKIEIGLNVETEKPPMTYIEHLKTHKENFFRWNKKSKKCMDDWGMCADYTNYKVKLYDKIKQTKVTVNPLGKKFFEELMDRFLLRYELQYHRKSEIKTLNNLKSLYQDNFKQEIKQKLISNFSKISFKEVYNISDNNINDLTKLFCYDNEEFRTLYFNKFDIEKRKAITRAIKSIKTKFSSNNEDIANLKSLVFNKIEYLFSS